MHGLTLQSVRRERARYAGWAISLLDSVSRPFTEPVGLRRAATPSRGHTRVPVALERSPARESEPVPSPAPRGHSVGIAALAADEQGSPLFVARPRRDARRPGKFAYRHIPYQSGMPLREGAFLSRRVGRRYVLSSNPVL